MARRIKIRLDADYISSAISEIRTYRKEIEDATRSLVEELVKEGYQICHTRILMWGALESGELLDSIEGIYDPVSGKGIIKTDCKHAAFVEFGTGVFVEGKAKAKYGNAGWWYLDKKQGRKRWTKGMEPRPFMHETYVELMEKAQTMARLKYHG